MIFTTWYLLPTSSLLVPNKTTFNLSCLSWMTSFRNLCLTGSPMYLSGMMLMLRLMPSSKILYKSYLKFIVATIYCFYIIFLVYPCTLTLLLDGSLLLLMFHILAVIIDICMYGMEWQCSCAYGTWGRCEPRMHVSRWRTLGFKKSV